MMATRQRNIDRERQWRKIQAGHYLSPKGRFEATRDPHYGGWWLVDLVEEYASKRFDRWRDARAEVERVEFADAAPDGRIELVEDELDTPRGLVVVVKVMRGAHRLGDVVARDGEVEMPVFDGPVDMATAEAFATALMLAAHHAARVRED